jgi:interleukin-1 receptor-associated kinase 1
VAKLADFGLARFIDHETELKTTCTIAGTLGYVDPDFVTTGKRSRESDVYSFGIVLLEIVSGRRPAVVDHQTMVTPLLLWVWGKHHGNAILEAADATLREESTVGERGQMERALLLGLWCAHPDPIQRPPIWHCQRLWLGRPVLQLRMTGQGQARPLTEAPLHQQLPSGGNSNALARIYMRVILLYLSGMLNMAK